MAQGPLWNSLPTAERSVIDAASWDAVRNAAGGGPTFAQLPTSTKHYLDETNYNAVVQSVPNIVSAAANLDFGNIEDGASAELTFNVTGATPGRPVIAGWPSTLATKIIGMMIVSAADTIQVRILNMSGGAINLPSLTFTAAVLL